MRLKLVLGPQPPDDANHRNEIWQDSSFSTRVFRSLPKEVRKRWRRKPVRRETHGKRDVIAGLTLGAAVIEIPLSLLCQRRTFFCPPSTILFTSTIAIRARQSSVSASILYSATPPNLHIPRPRCRLQTSPLGASRSDAPNEIAAENFRTDLKNSSSWPFSSSRSSVA